MLKILGVCLPLVIVAGYQRGSIPRMSSVSASSRESSVFGLIGTAHWDSCSRQEDPLEFTVCD
jgi:hypothetical protein